MKLKDCYRGYTDTMDLFREIEESCDGALTPNGVAIWMDNHEFELSRYGIPEDDVLSQMEGNSTHYNAEERQEAITKGAKWFYDKTLPGLMDVSDIIMEPGRKARWDKGEVPIEPIT